MTNKTIESSKAFFIETLRLYNANYRIFRYRLSVANFSIYEKKLLEAFVAYKRNKKDEALNPIKNLKISDSFLEAVRCYIIGLIYNQNAHFQFAIEHLEKSICLLKEQNDQDLILDPMVVLALAYSNKRQQDPMAAVLDQMKEYTPSTTFQKIQVLYIEVVYLEMVGEFTKAKSIIERINKKFEPDEVQPFKPFLNTLSFLMAFKMKNFPECYRILKDYKAFTGTNVKANYSYMKLLLDHLTKGSALYVYASDFKDFPELYHQLEVIKSLSIGDSARVEKFWAILHKHNPQMYAQDCTYHGDYTLFSVCLEKYQAHASKTAFDQAKIDAIPTLMDKLEYILTKTSSPLTKEELIGYLWKEESDEVNEARLKTLMARLRKAKNLNVICAHSTYLLDKSRSA